MFRQVIGVASYISAVIWYVNSASDTSVSYSFDNDDLLLIRVLLCNLAVPRIEVCQHYCRQLFSGCNLILKIAVTLPVCYFILLYG